MYECPLYSTVETLGVFLMVRLLVVICSFSGGGLSLGCLLYRNIPNVNNTNPMKHPKTNIGKYEFIFNLPSVDDLLINYQKIKMLVTSKLRF